MKKIKWGIFSLVIISLITIGLYHHLKSLPKGLSYEGKIHYTDEITFLHDLTYKNENQEITYEQEIFNEVFQMIEEAQELIVIDMFLFNSHSDQDRYLPAISDNLTSALIKQKQRYPNLQVVFITDPINNGYGSYEDEHIRTLKDNGIDVIITSLNELRDSNKPYSAVWRLFFQVFGQKGKGWLPNPFASEAPSFTLRSYLQLFNVKANHRKAVITENYALITSANPHDESGFASNIAFKVNGGILVDMLEAEQAIIDYSGGDVQLKKINTEQAKRDQIAVQYLTEGKILKHLIQEIDQVESGDTIWIGMFYLANRGIIDAIERATERGAAARIVLDPNQVAFGNQKIGLPNIPVASELHKNGNISIRWYETDEDQYHTKLLYLQKQSAEKQIIIGGSANYTTRNLDDLNLENTIKISANADEAVVQDVNQYFQRIWFNTDGYFTSDYETNEGAATPFLKFTYWLQKLTSLTTY